MELSRFPLLAQQHSWINSLQNLANKPLAPDSQNETDKSEVDSHVAAIDKYVFPGALFEERDDGKTQSRPSAAGEKPGCGAPGSRGLIIAQEESQIV